MIHYLKTDPNPFDAVALGLKTHEIRYNDRNFVCGDILILQRTQFTGAEMKEGKPLLYTGESYAMRVTHIQDGYGIKDGWAVLSVIECDDEYLMDAVLTAGMNR